MLLFDNTPTPRTTRSTRTSSRQTRKSSGSGARSGPLAGKTSPSSCSTSPEPPRYERLSKHRLSLPRDVDPRPNRLVSRCSVCALLRAAACVECRECGCVGLSESVMFVECTTTVLVIFPATHEDVVPSDRSSESTRCSCSCSVRHQRQPLGRSAIATL